jgi:asparagine synthase (glutamine-hydrolysing)
VLAQEPNIDIRYVTAPGCGPFDFDDLERGFDHLETPLRPFHYMDHALWRAARDSGVRLLMYGLGGDHMTSFDGRDSLFRLFKKLHWGKTVNLVKQLHHQQGIPVIKLLKSSILRPLLPTWMYHFYHGIKRGNRANEIMIDTPVNLDLARKYGIQPGNLTMNTNTSLRDYRAHMSGKIKQGHLTIEDEHIRQSHFGMCGLFPFFDLRILEFFMAVPPEQFLKGGVPRSLFRRAMEDILPPMIQWRKDKHPYTPDFHSRILNAKQDIHLFLNTIKTDDPVRSYIDIERIKKVLGHVQPVKDRSQWEIQTQAVMVKGIIYIKFLQWINTVTEDVR